jgi:hypothetical protein
MSITRWGYSGSLLATKVLLTLVVSLVQGSKPSETVYTTRTGAKYHRSSCSYLRKSKIEIKLADVKNLGLSPCSRCKPPEAKSSAKAA